MCGICGVLDTPIQHGGHGPETVKAMLAALSHRGPDDVGQWESRITPVSLGQRRLAIVDLTATGHQPMLSDDGRLAMVFNGEIYNHKQLRAELEAAHAERGATPAWRGTSDTETLLRGIELWGLEITIRKTVGMFAIALWDENERALHFARDRAGEKPLFFSLNQGRLAFASELGALLSAPWIPRTLNREALEQYLAFGYCLGTLTLVDGVKKVPPATILTYHPNTGQMRETLYWTPPPAADWPSIGRVPSIGQYVEELHFLLERATKMQLEADVTTAVLLSGGMDSSLIAALAAGNRPRVQTFTVGFPNAGRYDERAYARKVSDYFATNHTEIVEEGASIGLVEMMVRSIGEPLGDSSILPTFLVSRAVSKQVKVVLGGDGGDELFGGYNKYNWLLGQHHLARALGLVKLTGMVRRAGEALSPGRRGKRYVQALGLATRSAAARGILIFDQQERSRLVRPDFAVSSLSPEAIKEGYVGEGLSVLQTATRMDFHTYLPEDILTKVDRASMLCSLEVRAPFLDHRVVEFAYSALPDGYKVSARQRKIILRALGKKLLPPDFDYARKQGLSIPLKSWLQSGVANSISTAVRELPNDIFDEAYIGSLFHALQAGREVSDKLYSLAVLGMWMKEMKVYFR